ncbi:MAG TPA: membrane-bound O-acyltransferase family protein [Erysipelotrichaceae bacterium]|nr:membrane-bound O-acyltransferase family protein [Erysipelotrichaceae bacterium]
MIFSSLLFIFVFLSLNLLVYSMVPKKHRNAVLLGFSLVFYAWGGPRYLLLLLGETAISWWTAIRISQARKRSSKKDSRFWMIVEVVCLLGLLGIFKYLGFFMNTFNSWFGLNMNIPEIVLPIGISFYTFQLLSYVIDVYKGEVEAQQDFSKLLLYSSLFHQCIAGPIVRYKTIAEEIDNRKVSIDDIYYGIRRFSIGLAKKAVLANGVAKVADALASTDPQQLSQTSALGIWFGLLCYMLQIYLDFSAYSDMAIGMGRMVGFHYLENFDYPYKAKNVQDFWRRWHISLSTFFRDYVYIPLGGNRAGTWVYVRNMVVVWFLTGMWHGASWNYIFWGIYYLVFLLLEKFVIKEKIPSGWNRAYTLSVIFFGWMIFRYENMSTLLLAFKGLFGMNGGFASAENITMILSNIFLIAIACIGCTDLSVLFNKAAYRLAQENRIAFITYCGFETILPALLVFLSAVALIGNAYNPFLYFQF